MQIYLNYRYDPRGVRHNCSILLLLCSISQTFPSKLRVYSSVLFYLFIPKYLLANFHVQLTTGDFLVSKAGVTTLCPVCILADRKHTITDDNKIMFSQTVMCYKGEVQSYESCNVLAQHSKKLGKFQDQQNRETKADS